jgi:hypothetical protein
VHSLVLSLVRFPFVKVEHLCLAPFYLSGSSLLTVSI